MIAGRPATLAMTARRLVTLAVAVTGWLLLDATPAAADNCGSLSDCFDTLAAALAVTAALALLIALLLAFPPGGGLAIAGAPLIVGGSIAVPAGVVEGLVVTGVVAGTGAGILHMASSPGGGRNNRQQNRQFKEAVRRIERDLGKKLSRDQIQQLHREISKQGFTLEEIIETGLGLFQ